MAEEGKAADKKLVECMGDGTYKLWNGEIVTAQMLLCLRSAADEAFPDPKKVPPKDRQLQIGDHVIYIDANRNEHHAIVNYVWKGFADGHRDGCNLIIVSGDSNRQDATGRQIEHYTSVCHITAQPAMAWCWKWPDE